MAVLNIKGVSRILETNATARRVFKWAITCILYLMEQQRLIDGKRLEQVSLDWNRGTLNLGSNFTEMLVARAVGEYVIDRRFKRVGEAVTKSNALDDNKDKKTKKVDQ